MENLIIILMAYWAITVLGFGVLMVFEAIQYEKMSRWLTENLHRKER